MKEKLENQATEIANHLRIAFKVESDKLNTPVECTFAHTLHSHQRSCQRGINQHKIATALRYGEVIAKQGLLFYILGEKCIPDHLQKRKKSLKNTVVIVSGDSNQVITCYRSANPFKNIRCKSAQLSKRFTA